MAASRPELRRSLAKGLLWLQPRTKTSRRGRSSMRLDDGRIYRVRSALPAILPTAAMARTAMDLAEKKSGLGSRDTLLRHGHRRRSIFISLTAAIAGCSR